MDSKIPMMAEKNLLTIASRDPKDREDFYTPFWLNTETLELFQFTDKWVSVTKKYLEINRPESSKREDSEKIDVNTNAWKRRQEYNQRCGTPNTMET